jgi:hypothetical protein
MTDKVKLASKSLGQVHASGLIQHAPQQSETSSSSSEVFARSETAFLAPDICSSYYRELNLKS